MPAALLGFVLWKVNLEEVLSALGGLSWTIMVGSAALYAGTQLTSARRLQLVLGAMSSPISFIRAVRFTYIGLYASIFFPSSVGGDSIKVLGLISKGSTAGKALAGVMMDRVVGLAAALVLLPAAFWGTDGNLPPVGVLAWASVAALMGLMAVALVSRFLPLYKLTLLANGPHGRRGLWQRIKGEIASTILSMRAFVQNPREVFSTILLSLILLLMSVGGSWLVSLDLGIQVDYGVLCVIVITSYLASAIPISPGGLGVQEVSIIWLLSSIGVQEELAAALALIMRVWFLIVGLPILLMVIGEGRRTLVPPK
jgi:hypothetical protein